MESDKTLNEKQWKSLLFVIVIIQNVYNKTSVFITLHFITSDFPKQLSDEKIINNTYNMRTEYTGQVGLVFFYFFLFFYLSLFQLRVSAKSRPCLASASMFVCPMWHMYRIVLKQ